MIRTLVIDDEALARQGLLARLVEEPDFTVVGEAAGGREAVEAIEQLRPDLVFLDVQLPEFDGFTVLERAGTAHLPAVVFVTAYDRYAIKAFDAHALDYLLKPLTDHRFHHALTRVRRLLGSEGPAFENQQRLAAMLESAVVSRSPSPAPVERKATCASRFVIKDRDRFFFVRAERVDWFESAANYIELHAERRTYLMRMTMSDLENQVDPARFARIHRSTIVNIDRIREVRSQAHGDYAVVLTDGTTLRMGRGYRGRLL